MRKTRLVILPTKCLHQMGFLLLFLSCPVIGDWGRIRPDNENLQRAIQVEREGTCGLQRDTPGGYRDLTIGKGSDIRRHREDNDMNTRLSRFDERRDMRRLTRNDDRRVESRRMMQSRSVEPRRNDIRVRSLSLSRLEARRQTREETERRDGERRLSLARRESERRLEREDERTTRQNERIRTQRRENDRTGQRLSLQRREDEMRRNVREEPERRLSLSRMEEERRVQRSETRRAVPERRLEERRTDNRNDNMRRVVKSDNVRDERRMDAANRRMERLEKTRRVDTNQIYLQDKQESVLTGALKWLNLEKYEAPMIGDWSTNCVIGAVAYYLTTRQTKTV